MVSGSHGTVVSMVAQKLLKPGFGLETREEKGKRKRHDKTMKGQQGCLFRLFHSLETFGL